MWCQALLQISRRVVLVGILKTFFDNAINAANAVTGPRRQRRQHFGRRLSDRLDQACSVGGERCLGHGSGPRARVTWGCHVASKSSGTTAFIFPMAAPARSAARGGLRRLCKHRLRRKHLCSPPFAVQTAFDLCASRTLRATRFSRHNRSLVPGQHRSV